MLSRDEIPSWPRIQAQKCRYAARAAVIAADDELDANSPTLLRLCEALGPEFAVLSV
jgi:hypothetical protein